MEDLTAGVDGHALYLPAVQPNFARYVVGGQAREGLSVKPSDLDFLRADSPLWSYRYCLACGYYFMKPSAEPNMISHRRPGSWVLGDSGGFQIGTGALKGVDAPTADEVAGLWRTNDYRERLLRWFELNCDYAMTLDMPLWVKAPAYAKSPFHKCSVELLTDLTVENLRYFADHRGEYGACKFLNVLQGLTDEQDDYWYGRVRDFDFEGWAIGGSVAGQLDLGRVLKRLLVLRDDQLLGQRRDWLHFLGLGQLNWAVALTAIQRAIRGNERGPFGVSFDTASPTLAAFKFQNVYGPPDLTTDLRSWKVPATRFPTSYAAAVLEADDPFPPGSPLSSVLTLGDMNMHKGKYTVRRFDEFSHNALTSHNTYVLLAAVRAANEAAFGQGPLPQALADLIGLIGDVFEREEWAGLLSDTTSQTIIELARLSTGQGEVLAA